MNTIKPIGLVDLDGTLVNFDAAMVAQLNELASPDETQISFENAYDESKPWIKARRELIKNQPGFWKNLPNIPDGFHVLNLMKEVGFQLHVLTKGPYKNSAAWSEKFSWVRENLPDTPLTISEDKGMVYGRVLFDDWPAYINNWLEWRVRGLVIMLDQPWNQGFKHKNVFRYIKYQEIIDKPHKWILEEEQIKQTEELRKRLIEAKNR